MITSVLIKKWNSLTCIISELIYIAARLAFFTFVLAFLFTPTESSSEPSQDAVNLLSPTEIEDVFLRGLALVSAGEPRKAVILFRRILAKDPDLPRVRLELARAYFLMESWSESRREFVTVLSGDLPTAVRKNILRFIRAIDSRRGVDWNAAIGLSLSPEAGRDYKTDTIDLDFFGIELPFEVERKEKDVIGVRFDGSAEIRKGIRDFSDGTSLAGFIGASANIFEAKGSDYDDYIVSGNAGARLIWPQTTAEIAATASLRYRFGEIYEDRRGVRGSVEFRSESGFAPFASGSYSDVDVHETAARDGDLYGLGVGFSKSVFGFAQIGAFASFQRFDARESYESYDALGLSLVGQADVGFGINMMPQMGIEHRDYDANIPLVSDKRKDLELSFDLEINKTDIFLFNQFSPFLKIGYTHNDSDLDIFTYDEYRFLIGVKNAF